MSYRAAIPNALTLTNLGAGVVALFCLDIKIALICMAVGLVADVFDGAAARALGVSGDFGAILDSLADLVTFCVVPAVISYHTLYSDNQSPLVIAILVAYVLMGAYRLARFIVNTEEGTDFQGMPTPASAIAIMGLWIFNLDTTLTAGQLDVALILFAILGLLNVSKIRMLSLKGITKSRVKQIYFAVILLIALLLVWLQPQMALLLTIISYLILGIIYGVTQRENY